ncbi:hypothetical protein CRI94_03160 [Longibacter salinarum]|uniref:Uncharacterized protein n=1 Tax=Longibacter salinarum TaxID=1850348 RepID=A0A2A8D3B6_9BACT|nr:hypothetical protein [Longibacter salinarum]PEN15293.1 hypothetical protein CRI94_03160 [Longibacter salinarum]
MATYTVIGFTKDGFDRFTNVTQADDEQEAASKAIQDEFIKREYRRAPDTHTIAELENKTGLFVTGIIEGEHENLNENIDRHEDA